MTTAQKISALLNDDGQQWASDGPEHPGASLDDLCNALGGVIDTLRGTQGESVLQRHVFADDSTIVVTPAFWDIGYPDCWCCAGNGHSDDCDRK